MMKLLYPNFAIGKSALSFSFIICLPDFTALENVMFPALIQGIEPQRAKAEAEQLLELVGLKDRVSHRPGKLSGGEQQRVAVARVGDFTTQADFGGRAHRFAWI